MSSFKGKETRKFDGANRTPVPPKFRKGLGDAFVMMKAIHGEPCLVLFPDEAWDAFRLNVIGSYSGEEQALVERKLANRAEPLAVDKAGRITVKEDFKRYAGIEDEVLAVGLGNRVELWTPENWKKWNGDENDDDFGGLDLSGLGYNGFAGGK